MSKKFKHLTAYIHVSTAYVNADRGGFHEENLPVLNFSPEETLQASGQLNPQLILELEDDSSNGDKSTRGSNSKNSGQVSKFLYFYKGNRGSDVGENFHIKCCLYGPRKKGEATPHFVLFGLRSLGVLGKNQFLVCLTNFTNNRSKGWIDSVSAVAAVVLYSGVGLVRFIEGDHQLKTDIIPGIDTSLP
jgi:hypothetical protein